MSERGRHTRRSGMGFYRDVLFLVAGILIVGALVFGGLSLWAGRADDDPTPPAASPSLTQPDDSDRPSTTTTTSPSVSQTSTTQGETTTSTADTATTIRQARDPADVRAIVLNSIGVAGLAADLSNELADLGYQMTEASNYTPELSDTMIFHADGFAIEALELAEAVPDGTVASDQELADEWGVDVIVVVGRSYQE